MRVRSVEIRIETTASSIRSFLPSHQSEVHQITLNLCCLVLNPQTVFSGLIRRSCLHTALSGLSYVSIRAAPSLLWKHRSGISHPKRAPMSLRCDCRTLLWPRRRYGFARLAGTWAPRNYRRLQTLHAACSRTAHWWHWLRNALALRESTAKAHAAFLILTS